MRIVSKTKDYYDIVQSAGQDFDLQYVRTEIEEPLEPYPFLTFVNPRYYGPEVAISVLEYVIGFCGRVYPCLYLRPQRFQTSKPAICHTLADVDAFVEKAVRAKLLGRRFLDEFRKPHKYSFSLWSEGWRRVDFQKFFERYSKQQDSDAKPFNVSKYFEEKRVPIFVAGYKSVKTARGVRVRRGTITYNAMLRPHEFMRVFDPYTAFQEVQMYMANMAMPDRPIPQLSNDDLAHSKGHGGKYSFRRAPSK